MSGSYARRMHRYASRIKLVFYLLIAISAVSAYFWPQDSPDRVELFADRLRSAIIEGRVEDLQALPCRPVNCVNDRVLRQVFGDSSQEGFVQPFLKRPEVILRVYGPFSLEQLMDGEDYLLFFYDPHVMRFAERAYPSAEDQRKFWRKSYLETRVSYRDGTWTLIGAPFLWRPATEIDLGAEIKRR